MILLELAALDRREQADRPDRMLVDRIMMVHVELHLRDDAAEVGNEAAEHAGFVHPPQHGVGLVDVGQHLHEQGVGPRIVAHLAVDQRRVAGRRAHRRRMDFQPLARRQREELEQPHRIGLEESVGRNRDAAAVEHEAAEALRAGGGCVGSANRKPFLPSCSSSWARNTPVRSPTVFALRK